MDVGRHPGLSVLPITLNPKWLGLPDSNRHYFRRMDNRIVFDPLWQNFKRMDVVVNSGVIFLK